MFLDKLPIEIRYQVYGHAANLEESFQPYHGLYYSCHQIKHEMDFECTRLLKKQVGKLQEQVSRAGLVFTLDDSDGSPAKRSLSISVTDIQHIFKSMKPHCRDYSNLLIELLRECHFESVNIVYKGNDRTRLIKHAFDGLLFTTKKVPRVASARRLTIEVPPLDIFHASLWYDLAGGMDDGDQAWVNGWGRAEWVRTHGERIRAKWEVEKKVRKELEIYKVLGALQDADPYDENKDKGKAKVDYSDEDEDMVDEDEDMEEENDYYVDDEDYVPDDDDDAIDEDADYR